MYLVLQHPQRLLWQLYTRLVTACRFYAGLWGTFGTVIPAYLLLATLDLGLPIKSRRRCCSWHCKQQQQQQFAAAALDSPCGPSGEVNAVLWRSNCIITCLADQCVRLYPYVYQQCTLRDIAGSSAGQTRSCCTCYFIPAHCYVHA
jgi:hypothetical protein